MRMKPTSTILAALLFSLSAPAFGGASGIYFDPEEIAMNRQYAGRISDKAKQCLDNYWSEHAKFFEANNYSKFYGNRNRRYATPDFRQFALLKILRPDIVQDGEEDSIKKEKATAGVHIDKQYVGLSDYIKLVAKRDRALAAEITKMKPDLARRERELKNISCVDLARRCLAAGFQAVGMEETWQKIDEYMLARGVSGVEMMKGLVDLGWVSYYWNPDPSQNAAWDELDKVVAPLEPGRVWMPVWGGHLLRYNSVMKKRDYFGVPVRDAKTFVGFQKQPPQSFNRVPFFVGTAHAGYHVFPGTLGKVVEAHSVRALSSKDNLEFSPFNPLDQENHGGPVWTKDEHYRSGLIVVPPGMFQLVR